MSYRHTLEALLESLHELEDMVKGFPSDGKIPALELDLTMQKMRNLYEIMLMLRESGREITTQPRVPELAKEPAIATDSKKSGPEPVVAAEIPDKPAVTNPGEAGADREPQVLSDRFKGRSTLHESLHHTLAKEGSIISQVKPVQHLMTAIGINDRFTFMRELFNNDPALFEKTIKTLDEAASFNDAYNYMIQHFDWDMDSTAVQLLLEIIRRKFITGRHE
jgi:hypothetical protein